VVFRHPIVMPEALPGRRGIVYVPVQGASHGRYR
jgi:hypothetical protein